MGYYGSVYTAVKSGKYRKVFLVLGVKGKWGLCEECDSLSEAKCSLARMVSEGIYRPYIDVIAREVR